VFHAEARQRNERGTREITVEEFADFFLRILTPPQNTHQLVGPTLLEQRTAVQATRTTLSSGVGDRQRSDRQACEIECGVSSAVRLETDRLRETNSI
jgi:hypothetical protein